MRRNHRGRQNRLPRPSSRKREVRSPWYAQRSSATRSKYHVVFIPQGRKQALYGKSRGLLGPVLRELAGQRGSTIIEGHLVQDHVHMLIRMPPKDAVAEVLGSLKGKSAIAVARQCGGRQRNCNGERFWARG